MAVNIQVQGCQIELTFDETEIDLGQERKREKMIERRALPGGVETLKVDVCQLIFIMHKLTLF